MRERERERKTSFLKFSNFIGKKLGCIYSAQIDNQHPTLFLLEKKKTDYELLDIKTSKYSSFHQLMRLLAHSFYRVSALMELPSIV